MERFLSPGDRAVDATCGNGHDTLLLARLVGPEGRVWAFDIQEKALEATRTRLEQAGLADQVDLLLAGHETMADHVPSPVNGMLFNLGYLPGGDRNLITRTETTRTALEQALSLLLPGGVLAVTAYPGHEGGNDEETMLMEWAAALPQRSFHVWSMGQPNTPADAPHLVLVQRCS